MQTIIGNVTANATVQQTPDGRTVVNFTIAENDRFNVKGSKEPTQVTNFYKCSYWMGAGIAPHIQKGMLIQVIGRIGLSVWISKAGEAKGNLTVHVQEIKLHGKANPDKAIPPDTPAITETAADDLPF